MTVTAEDDGGYREGGTFRERHAGRGGDRWTTRREHFRVEAAKPWSAGLLAFVLPLTPDDILSRSANGMDPVDRAEWRMVDLAQRLVWLYGADEALRRLNGSVPTGDDPEPMAVAA